MKKLFRKIWSQHFLVSLLLINLALFCSIGLLLSNTTQLIAILENKIDIYEIKQQEQVKDLTEFFCEIIGLTIENDTEQLEVDGRQQKSINDLTETLIVLGNSSIKNDEERIEATKRITENLKKLKEKQLLIERKLEASKISDLDNVEDIKKANLVIYNSNAENSCSGTHIKINNKSYILTCSHILEKPDDSIWGILDNGDWEVLQLSKINVKKDLALFRIYGIDDLPYLEISNKIPKEKDEVIVVGNPASMIDVITDGIIAKINGEGYLLTNKIFMGSSGGAALDSEGKIIGVIVLLRTLYEIPTFVNYGYSSKLETIQEFLEGVR